ncbi:NAD(P)/FAD-dependent oxidoreductase [Candidatus Mycobacterium methanotrophicum]|uniref:FAD-binding oxidoreductase n=1 Tax=Candidatus Mycobacterium methanotrophicum TaxID=2943498 RepID=A0ABY4QP62_9MYCO|nr:FAD-dependent oxidoreductase [Candidatus Mycobacterium methanotrophicum]UQX11745.1 FAD-binding oxidoreductase [Candidatus Mycobacterium methanotrophicum]
MRQPRSAIVVGAGIVGLSTAWFLQERGVAVTVVDRTGVAAGASWGNAGWIAPALSIPLNDPQTLRYALRSLPNHAAPVRVSLSIDPALWRFLVRFALNCRESSWRRAVRANLTLNHDCMAAYDLLVSHGVDAPITDAPITALFRASLDAEHLLEQLRRLQDAGQPSSTTELTGAALREQVPLASSAVAVGVRINGQRFVDPARFVQALGRSVVERGAALETMDVADVRTVGDGVAVAPHTGSALMADAAVIATGAWLPGLVKRWVRVPVQAGRGYSFTVPVERKVFGPIYLPDVRVACTPLNGKLRVTSMMELRRPDAPVSAGVVDAIVDAAAQFFDGVRWAERDEIWVGPRPLSPDGRPLVGSVLENRVFVAGGHGMWGMKQGPATGRLLAEQIATGKQPPGLREFDPLR